MKRKSSTNNLHRSIQSLECFWDRELNQSEIWDHPSWSQRKFYWKHVNECGCVHIWTAELRSMRLTRQNIEKIGCSICKGVPGYRPCCAKLKNALVSDTTFQSIQHEWSPNELSHPESYYRCSHAEILWRHQSKTCGCIHEWKALISSRVARGDNCPICAHKSPPCCTKNTVFENEDLMMTWDHVRNAAEGFFPDKMWLQSNIKVYWICPKSCDNQSDCIHSWPQSPNIRRQQSSGCPFCSHKSLIPCCKKKSLAADRYTEIVSEIHPDDLKSLGDLRLIYPCIKRDVRWICKLSPCGCVHEWIVSLDHRITSTGLTNKGCPWCSTPPKKICCQFHSQSLMRFDDQAKLRVLIVSLMTRGIDPHTVAISSNKAIEVDCPCGKIFTNTVTNITRPQREWCPYCSGQGVSKIACQYMDEYEKNFDVKIQHRHFSVQRWEGDEYKVLTDDTSCKVDGFMQPTTVIEFLGDYYHGNPRKYNHSHIFHGTQTFGDLYIKTKVKLQKLAKIVTVFYVWEMDFRHWLSNRGLPFPVQHYQMDMDEI